MAGKKKDSSKPAQVAGLTIAHVEQIAKIMSQRNEKKIIRYMKGQEALIADDLKVYEVPIEDERPRSPMHEIEQMVLRKRLSHLRGMIRTIELMIEEDEEVPVKEPVKKTTRRTRQK